MKTTKQQNNKSKIKFLIPMILLVFAVSCKKDKIEESRPKTVAEFEKVMATNLDLQSFISASISLENIELSKYDQSVVLMSSQVKKHKTLNEEDIVKLKTIKTYDSLLSFFKDHQIDNAEERVEMLKKQSLSFYSFINEYPEFKLLSIEDKKLLLLNSLKSRPKHSKILEFNILQNQGKLMVADDANELFFDYNNSISACRSSYRSQWITIWATTDIALLGAAFDPSYISTAVIFTSAVTATLIAESAMFDCFDDASSIFFSKFSRLDR